MSLKAHIDTERAGKAHMKQFLTERIAVLEAELAHWKAGRTGKTGEDLEVLEQCVTETEQNLTSARENLVAATNQLASYDRAIALAPVS